jgi:hypothetical protein
LPRMRLRGLVPRHDPTLAEIVRGGRVGPMAALSAIANACRSRLSRTSVMGSWVGYSSSPRGGRHGIRSVLDRTGRRRSAATLSGFHSTSVADRATRGPRYPPDPPTVEEIFRCYAWRARVLKGLNSGCAA